MRGLDEIKNKLAAFKRQYYIRQLLLGTLAFLIINSLLFLVISGLEHQFWLSVGGRTLLFFSYVISLITTAYFFIFDPLLKWGRIRKGLTDEEAAIEIANHFPEIKDQLLNTLQLGNLSPNELLHAAINKKSSYFHRFHFVKAVDFSATKKYASALLLIIFTLALLSFISPSLLKDSPDRIIHFKQEFSPEAPFRFLVLNEELNAFRGEDFVLKFSIEGDMIPDKVRLWIAGDPIPKPLTVQKDESSFVFENIRSDQSTYIEAAGFRSKNIHITVLDRPDLISMIIRIKQPDYTGGQTRMIENTGNLTVLEGATVDWDINTLATDSALLTLNGKKELTRKLNDTHFAMKKHITESGEYTLDLFNKYSKNTSKLSYYIEVIKDQYPKIIGHYFPDTLTYHSIAIAGNISDDYGFTGLYINYKTDNQEEFVKVPVEISKNTTNQGFYTNWKLDSIDIKPNNKLEIYLSVLDNDGTNGPKESRTPSYILTVPTEDEIQTMIADRGNQVKDQLSKAEKKAEQIAARLEEIENRLKSEQKFDWQEKKILTDIIKDRDKLTEEIEKLQKQHQELIKSRNEFQNQSKQVQQKSQKMQELLQQLMDQKTMELYEKLKALMRENASSDEISQQLQELKKSEKSLEQDLERAIELFKRLKMESTLEQNLQKLDTLSKRQDELSQKPSDPEEQKSINQDFEGFRNRMDEIEQMNQELKRPEAMEDFELEERQIAKNLQEILDQMEQGLQQQNTEGDQKVDTNDKNEKERTQQKQKKAAEKMRALNKKLSKMQGGMQMEMMQANLDQLRDVLDNLVKLSFHQEDIMLEMREVNQSDPRFIELSQNQLKLKDDAKVIQDSLLSLASKVVQISAYITREVNAINENIDEAVEYLKDRNKGRALSSQQFAMTSINNLALLLDDTMQQMQMAMSEAMGNSGKEKKPSQGLPDLQELQNQLGEKIQELKGSGKSGRQLSEELAKLAAEQEMIRRQMEILKEAEDGKPGGGVGGDQLKKAIDMMEKNEVDLVNKRLTQQLISRQKQIMTRMLEAENAQRDQEMDEEREAETAGSISQEVPPGFEKYLQLKKKEIELLKTIPIELNPFYKKEVNDYFRRLSSEKEND